MHRIAKLTRAQVETLVFVGVLALLHVISSVFNVPAGVDSDRSMIASSQATTFGPAGSQLELVKF